ncbi:hypothetical protein ABZ942_15475 [Nocardia sp. NPDC046473]|uniref:hypothetical protein n=1 Tax=Nocardia sp. NPDC046473 TaxID=3155733 RepID=UPI0033D0E465
MNMSNDVVDDAVSALAQRVAVARGKLPLQHDAALTEVLSESELAAERELAEWVRAQRRTQRRRGVEIELATEKRARRAVEAIEREEAGDARWHRRALAARRRAASADARLAQLYRRAEWSSRALIAVVVLGMVWAGVNVQHNLVPDSDIANPLYWLSYGVEAMISIPLITIMVVATTAARWGRSVQRGKVALFEATLLITTVALNTGPHLAAGELGRAGEYAVAPVMVGVVIWLHAWVSARYAILIDGAVIVTPAASTEVRAGSPVVSGVAAGSAVHASAEVDAVPTVVAVTPTESETASDRSSNRQLPRVGVALVPRRRQALQRWQPMTYRESARAADGRHGRRAGRQVRRDPAVVARVIKLHEQKTAVTEISAQVGVSTRTVGRILADHATRSAGQQRAPAASPSPRRAATAAGRSNNFRLVAGGTDIGNKP